MVGPQGVSSAEGAASKTDTPKIPNPSLAAEELAAQVRGGDAFAVVTKGPAGDGGQSFYLAGPLGRSKLIHLGNGKIAARRAHRLCRALNHNAHRAGAVAKAFIELRKSHAEVAADATMAHSLQNKVAQLEGSLHDERASMRHRLNVLAAALGSEYESIDALIAAAVKAIVRNADRADAPGKAAQPLDAELNDKLTIIAAQEDKLRRQDARIAQLEQALFEADGKPGPSEYSEGFQAGAEHVAAIARDEMRGVVALVSRTLHELDCGSHAIADTTPCFAYQAALARADGATAAACMRAIANLENPLPRNAADEADEARGNAPQPKEPTGA